MAAGQLRAIVCTATLDLGIDWGDVDLVVNVGAPKGRAGSCSGSAGPTTGWTSRRRPIWCRATASRCWNARRPWTPSRRPRRTPRRPLGALDVLAQHVLGMACADAFDPLGLYEEIVSASPYAGLTWESFEQVVDYVATGGYALRAYERFAKILRGARRAVAGARRPDGAGLPDECRHDRRGGTGAGAARPDAAEQARHRPAEGRTGARRDRGRVRRHAHDRRHLPVRRRDPAVRGPGRGRGPGDPRAARHRSGDPLICGREVSALDLPGRAGPGDHRRPVRVGPPSEADR